jgi:hypothetical protein
MTVIILWALFAWIFLTFFGWYTVSSWNLAGVVSGTMRYNERVDVVESTAIFSGSVFLALAFVVGIIGLSSLGVFGETNGQYAARMHAIQMHETSKR